ncbi:MAG: putative pre-16S rRNA nuclease [Chroococcopsis gigantea SAG 12.99]|jgi:putative Holliday junction resolvase|nr:Holliday junction resolvase RuvX [Chlorogloea purpurea SAG 13.99]MDV3001255.1 putative pre-16S rRNA nuclease [Chroococcopsis gigantea SAG 12.99]
MPEKVSALGLDVGKKRVGVAGCDGTGLIATGLTTLERTTFAQDVEWFKKLIAERDATVLVVGLPYTMDGGLGKQAEQVQRYAERLKNALDIALEYVDERCTSIEAEEYLKQKKGWNSRDKARIDRVAATIILQQWLDQQRNSNSENYHIL